MLFYSEIISNSPTIDDEDIGKTAETVTISNPDYHRLDKTATCSLMKASQKPLIRNAMKNGSDYTS